MIAVGQEDKKVRCSFCGREGVYGEDIVDTYYYDDFTEREKLVFSCRDIEACIERGGRTKAIY